MQFVKTEDLKIGMRLAKPIYNRLGVLLYERNTALTAQGINSIRKFSLIGIYILEPSEPVPPLTEEELKFEKFQTVYMFRLRDELQKLADDKAPDKLTDLCRTILREYGSLPEPIRFSQNHRSSGDFVYKHALNVAILCALISHKLGFSTEEQLALIASALLYDTGYLYLEAEHLFDSNDVQSKDYSILCTAREKAFSLLKPKENPYHFSTLTLSTIEEMISPLNHPNHPSVYKNTWLTSTQILRVADCFDQLTSMRYGADPQSDVMAIRHLRENTLFYNTEVVNALAECIHLLPTGTCVDLSTGEKGMIIEANSKDFLQPIILKFSDNELYDLSQPDILKMLQVSDIMQTMDMRIPVDEETIKQFNPDEHLIEITNSFRKIRARRELKENKMKAKKLI